MRLWLIALVLSCQAFACVAEEFEITAIERNGTLTWDDPYGDGAYSVEWSSSSRGPWRSWQDAAAELTDIGASGGQITVSVPMFYRVGWEQPPPAGMVLIRGGTFTMGDWLTEGTSDELPLHQVALSPFYMDRFEVTMKKWNEVYPWAVANEYSFDSAGSAKGDNHPLYGVSWYDVVKWCNARSEKEGLTPCYYTSAEKSKATVYRSGTMDIQNDWVRWDADGYRLPTEAEWEYAARGGVEARRFPWADSNSISHSRANYRASYDYPYDDSYPGAFHPDYDSGSAPYTSPAGSFAPNDYGVYDMAGNFLEMCWDRYDEAYYTISPVTEPHGPDSGENRLCRGGSWVNTAFPSRVADRGQTWPGNGFNYLGFRSVRGAP